MLSSSPTAFLPIAPVVIPNNPAPAPGLTIVAGVGLPLAVDESFIPGIGSQAVVAGSPASNIVTQPFASSFTVDAPAGVQSITYAMTLSSNAVDSGLIDSVTGTMCSCSCKMGRLWAGRDRLPRKPLPARSISP